jgi:hypothetical protein
MSCDCNPIVVGEAGPQGSQGLAGINGTNGTNGVNAYTTTTASYTQPAVDSAVNISVANSSWIAVGQYIYIQATGYYLVNTVPTSTSINATLKISEASGTITSNKKVTPSGNVVFTGSGSSLTITGASSFNTSGGANDTVISTDGDANAVFVKGSNDRVGVGTNSPETKFQVVGDVKIGNSSTDGGLVVTKNTTLNSKNTASIVALDVIGSTSGTHLIYAESTYNTVVIGSATATSGKKLKVVGDTRMEGALETTGATTLASLTVSGASSTGSISATSITASTTLGVTGQTTLVNATASGIVSITGNFGRGAPVTKTADFTVAATENFLINNKSGSTCTVTLPNATTYPGREITIKTIQAQTVISASSNVVSLDGTSTSTAILSGTAGKWATLVSSGSTNWIIMASN